MINEEFEEIFSNVPFENIEKIKKYIQEKHQDILDEFLMEEE